MNLRITILIPLLLVVSTLATSVAVYFKAKSEAETSIRKEVLSQVKLDITRLQNVLYNRLTERANNLEDARLNLSVTAMEPMFRILVLTDENNQVLMANRYTWEGSLATRVFAHFEQSLAQQVKQTNNPIVHYLAEDNTLLHGYYPVILQLESEQGVARKRMGILFVEVSIASKLAHAYSSAANQSFVFAGFMLAVALLVAWLLHLLISKRLNQLNMAARHLAGGNLDARASLQGKDELALVGSAFDEMASRIKSDIHRRQQAEEELRKLNDTLEDRISERTELLQEAQRIGRIGNWSWDVESGELYWSDQIYRIFGYEPGEIKPSYERFIAALHPDDVERVKASEQAAFSKGNRHSIDHRIILPNGEERWVHEEAIASFNQQGQQASLTGTVQDITERKLTEQHLLKAKEEAERASKAKSVFLSRMSHELRTPMNAILGFAQVMQMEELTDDQLLYIQEIRQAGGHLLALISELLDLSRIEAGRMMLVMQNIHLKEVMQEAINISKPLMTDNQIELQLDCPEKYSVIADTVRLRQVLVNLLSNAAKYNKAGGSIRVSCEERNEILRISVHDTGMGIKADNLQKLFKPFERMDAEYSGVDGAGIGLALSKQLMELMNGQIGVESQINQGSTFWIELHQAKQRHEEETVNPAVLAELTDTCKVLYIEDNIANYRVVEAVLRHYPSLKLLAAQNGYYGLEMALEYQPDIILLDIHLPDISGYQVLEQLRALSVTRSIPVIALSADAMPIDVERGLAAGFADYLTKPIDAQHLVEALTRHGMGNKRACSKQS